MVKNILIKCPDEWATTKQACRDESVVYLFLSSTNIYIYIMINSSKISIHRFIATTLFRVVKEWPHSSGNIHE